ncbi:MAG TPA: hypothetical protein VK811_03000 [Candidatus Acidoferrum sp.]|nr:hypothetical protein [Candidatus Acidoferrum sp.]
MGELIEGLRESAAQTGGAVSNVEEMSAALMELANTADAVRGTFEKTWTAIEAGARLQGLSSVTGESVGKLYEFERGLEAVGKKASYLPTIFADMQRALSATGEKGDRMKSLFSQLHLNIDQLRREDTAGAVMQVAGALGKLDPNTATGLGSQIFGRFQTGTVLAIARDKDLFQQTMRENYQAGQLLEEYSKSFEQIKAERGNINSDVLGFQAAMTGKIAPNIQEIYANIQDDVRSTMLAAAMQPSDFSGVLMNPVIAERGKFKTDFDKLMAAAFGDPKKSDTPDAKNLDLGPNHFKPEFTSLEKMGFIMSGEKVQNPYHQRSLDLLQQIAENTKGPVHTFSVPMPDDKHLRDIIDPSPFVSNIV